MKFKELLKEYKKYYIAHCPLLFGIREFDDGCDDFITWYFKQKYYSQPHKCAKCKQVKMLVYNDDVCSDCDRIEWEDLYAIANAKNKEYNKYALVPIEQIKKEKRENIQLICITVFFGAIDVILIYLSFFK